MICIVFLHSRPLLKLLVSDCEMLLDVDVWLFLLREAWLSQRVLSTLGRPKWPLWCSPCPGLFTHFCKVLYTAAVGCAEASCGHESLSFVPVTCCYITNRPKMQCLKTTILFCSVLCGLRSQIGLPLWATWHQPGSEGREICLQWSFLTRESSPSASFSRVPAMVWTWYMPEGPCIGA